MALIDCRTVPEGKQAFCFCGREMLVAADGSAACPSVLPADAVADMFEDSALGAVGVELKSGYSPADGCRFINMRQFFAERSEEEAAVAARLKAMASWRKSTRFCPGCGHALEPHAVEDAMVCPSCGRTIYPRIEPCVIAVIMKGDEILLLRHKQRNTDIFACLAGFVEAGETFEQALVREVREETGLEIDNIRYAGSQSWPFPDQLMVAFYADYRSGEIKVQEDEISEARWFRRDELPPHPGPGSISWRLIHFDF